MRVCRAAVVRAQCAGTGDDDDADDDGERREQRVHKLTSFINHRAICKLKDKKRAYTYAYAVRAYKQHIVARSERAKTRAEQQKKQTYQADFMRAQCK